MPATAGGGTAPCRGSIFAPLRGRSFVGLIARLVRRYRGSLEHGAGKSLEKCATETRMTTTKTTSTTMMTMTTTMATKTTMTKNTIHDDDDDDDDD